MQTFMLGEKLRLFIFCLSLFSSFIYAQSDYSHYPTYLEDIYTDGTVKRCFDVMPIQNTSPKQARILDFTCPKSLPCYQCSFNAALFRIESIAYYNGYSKTIPYLDGELRLDQDGFWQYIVLPPYDDENLLHDPTYMEEYEKKLHGISRQ